jgi:RNA polymerase sigma-70 factor (ECF subfamily)
MSAQLDRDTFLDEAEAYRRELLAHCYKMVGSLHEAEDLVQETYVRAWRGWDGFEGRSSVRTWLYRIATNLCLTALGPQRHRLVPSGLGTEEGQQLERAAGLASPFPTGRTAQDPALAAETRAGLRLALVTSLQHLPPRQRAVLILREALSYSALEIAELLEMSVPAVKSALQRARARLDALGPTIEDVAEPDDTAVRRALDDYMRAFETADIALLRQLLKAETVLEVHPGGLRRVGMVACLDHLEHHVLHEPGRYRMVATTANGQPAAATYRRDAATGRYLPFGVVVLTTEGERITRIDVFPDPWLVPSFLQPSTPSSPSSTTIGAASRSTRA